MNHLHHQDCDGLQTNLCEWVLLAIWPHLGDFHSSLAPSGGDGMLPPCVQEAAGGVEAGVQCLFPSLNGKKECTEAICGLVLAVKSSMIAKS